MDQQILQKEKAIDIVVRGEGELTFLEIVQKVSNKNKLKNIEGITFRKDKQIIKNPTDHSSKT